MDRLTRARRSALMTAVRSKDTRPEFAVRKLLSGLGYRYRLHVETLPGKPDIAMPGARKVIFVHGCFWHGHKRCRWGSLPKSNLGYWRPKIAGNKARDVRNRRKLRRLGWRSLVVWQCEISNLARLQARLQAFANG